MFGRTSYRETIDPEGADPRRALVTTREIVVAWMLALVFACIAGLPGA